MEMASYRIYANMNRMKTTAREIRVKAGEYRRTGNQLINTVISSDKWKGRDAEVYKNQLSGFREDLENMPKLMQCFATLHDQASEQYRQIQDVLVQQAKSLC